MGKRRKKKESIVYRVPVFMKEGKKTLTRFGFIPTITEIEMG
jgi:hypothetical protein